MFKCSNSVAAIQHEVPADFAQDVLKGLSGKEKRLDSKYLYNDRGSQLFQAIMDLEEYYLTRCEEEIFTNQKQEIFEIFAHEVNQLDIIELGAGDGAKTKVLLKHIQDQVFPFSYTAIDISGKALQSLEHAIKLDMPAIEVLLLHDDYLKGLTKVPVHSGGRKILLFLGSNIGNFSPAETIEFLKNIRSNIQEGDQVMIGFDLRKSAEQILKAYNDTQGITSLFNLNLLQRINEELGGNFDLAGYTHYPVYDAEKGEARSYLRSLKDQEVWIEAIGTQFKFSKDELIHTEISRKYSLDEIHELAVSSGFKVTKNLLDSKKYFCDSIWTAI